MMIGEFLEHLSHWETIKPSPFEPIELPAPVPRGFVVCECGAPYVWIRHRSLTNGTTQEVTAAYVGQCDQCLRIYWHP